MRVLLLGLGLKLRIYSDQGTKGETLKGIPRVR